MPELIRKGQAAEVLGVSAPRISQLLRAGHLSEVAGTGMLLRAEVEQFAECRMGQNAREGRYQPLSKAEAPEPRSIAPIEPPLNPSALGEAVPPIAESRKRLEALRAAIAQHDLDTRSGKLVSREEVARAAFQEGQRLRQALEGLPYRIGHGLAGALGLDAVHAAYVVQEVMGHEIRQLLLSLAEDPDEAIVTL